MWDQSWREQTWEQINQEWDVLIIGGGITGAGILRLATAYGLRALLVDANDFTFGTSSRSSKLVHGGFRYLYNRQYKVTRESVREREWLRHEAKQLVNNLPFILPNYESYHFPTWVFGVGVTLYDLLAPKWDHKPCNRNKIIQVHPGIKREGLLAGFCYCDANVDDSRLVLRLLKEACAAGGNAINYVRAGPLLKDARGEVHGAVLTDTSHENGPSREVHARVVVNATGPWTDDLRQQVGGEKRLRKLRGSHLIFPQSRFPLPVAVTLFHPKDHRAMFALPWEGNSIIGTTDIDHDPGLEAIAEPFASEDEIQYLLDATTFLFPGLNLERKDIISTFSGLRPVISTGAATPSKESRAHAIWEENGLITITGGKLTTFRIMARQTLQAILKQFPDRECKTARTNFFEPLPDILQADISAENLAYIEGRLGQETPMFLESAPVDELSRISNLPNHWAELRWAAQSEAVVHLSDLLLRRVRLGMLLPDGAREQMQRIRAIVQPALGWDDPKWTAEETAYWNTWKHAYSPEPGGIK